MTDLERFIELYRSLGIECIVNRITIDPQFNGRSIKPEIKERQAIHLGGDDYRDIKSTSSEKFDGYGGFFSNIEFDMDGNFISQGFWE